MITDTSIDSIYQLNISGEITFINSAGAKMYGYKPEQMIGLNLKSLMLEEEYFAKGKNILKKILSGRCASGEIKVKHKNGHNFPIRYSVVPIYKNNEIVGFTGISRDITEQKFVEKELKYAKKTADAANKAKSEFLANISHELRTPLFGILGFSQILETKEAILKDEKLSKYLKNVIDSGKHLLTLVNDILDLSKIEAKKMEIEKKPFNFKEMLQRAPSSVKSLAANKNINIEENIAPDLGWLNGEEKRIKQVIYNLLSNAIKFTEQDKCIGIEAYAEEDKIITIIWDHGIGIPEDSINLIFYPFKQLHDGRLRTMGTGLGLAISKQLVEMHEGTILVKSKVNKGSRFIITLPGRLDVESKEYSKKKKPIKTDVEYSPKKGSILVVEDNFLIMEIINETLNSPGLDIDNADNGKKAIELASGKEYDIILMDIQLPGGIDGVTAMKKIRKLHLKPVTIIALTAYAMADDEEKYTDNGFDGYISKPFELELLRETIKKYIRS